MAALEALMPQALPPAGDPVVLARDRAAPATLDDYWPGYRARYYDSGTAALAAAVRAVTDVAAKPEPEVLLPAYGCPALVSAVLHAGARPVLVDIEPDQPRLSLRALSEAVSGDTVAVIAVHLFGLRERVESIRAIVRPVGAVVIEDSAQGFDPGLWQSDLVVLSFGRGKPVSLLGGGAVLHRGGDFEWALPRPQIPGGGGFRFRALAYNLLRNPSLYWLPHAIPGLGLGQTRFERLRRIWAMDECRRALLPTAVARYRAQEAPVQQQLRTMLGRLGPDFVDVAELCGEAPSRRLIRYPVLAASRELRDQALQTLTRLGLGASPMYGAALADIAGVAPVCRARPAPAADDFAQRLFTLPVHGGVRPRHVHRMQAALEACVARGRGVLIG